MLRSRPFSAVLLVLSLPAIPATRASAQPNVGDDPTAAGAAIDGALSPGEYAARTSGIGAGFGGMIGAGTTLFAEAAQDGSLALLLDSTTGNCNFGVDDSLVLYIDSRAGGFGSTATFTDTTDPGRAAASGKAPGFSADLTFAPGFGADFALVVRGDSGSLFELAGGGLHVFVKTLTRAPSVGFGTSCIKEIGGLTMADLGSGPGGAFDYVATLINASNAYRSNEFHGVAAAMGTADPLGNIGANAFSLAAGDMNTFQSFEPVASLVRHKRAYGFNGWTGAGFQPAATLAAGQLPSDNWATTGWTDGVLAFGGTATTGDHARGTASAPVTTGGSYMFDLAGDPSFGIQPGSGDFAPGTLTLRLVNATGGPLIGVRVGYELRVRNDQNRSSTFDLAVSNDGSSFTTLSTYASPLGMTGTSFTLVPVQAETTSLPVAAGGLVYVRFSSADAGGSGSRDELALDDLVVTPLASLCPPNIDDGNACTTDVCDPMTGTVTHPPAAAGSPCSDNDLCTTMDACDGAGTCDTTPVLCVPPAAECVDAVTSRTYSNGACDPADGMCDFTVTDTVCANMCDVASGFCDDDPCVTVTCDMPPPAECIGDESVVYGAPGQCIPGTGMCDYPSTSEVCADGCDPATGLCSAPDPCATMTCDAPPSACYEARGTCADGACSYAPKPSGSPCDDGSAQTSNDTCDGLGQCSGAPVGPDGGGGGTGGAGGGAEDGGEESDGCGCAVPSKGGRGAGALWLLALVLARRVLRRRGGAC